MKKLFSGKWLWVSLIMVVVMVCMMVVPAGAATKYYDLLVDKITISSLTTGYLPLISTNGLLINGPAYSGGSITTNISGSAGSATTAGTATNQNGGTVNATEVKDDDLTDTQVVFSGAAGILQSDTHLTWIVGTDTLNATNFVGNGSGLTGLPGAGLYTGNGDLSAGNANAFSFSWQNPQAYPIIITEIMIEITTIGGTALAIMDVGTGDTATTVSNNLLNDVDLQTLGISVSTARIVMTASGGANDFITGQILTANAAALDGEYYITYKPQ